MADNVNYRSMLPPGTLLKRGMYRVERYLGSGNFGNTYVVSSPNYNRPLAMKEFFLSGFCFRGRDGRTLTLSPSANPQTFLVQREKFKKEDLRLRGLRSQHVVHVHDMFEEFGTVYYIMDYIDGESFADLLERTHTPLPEAQALNVMYQILDALDEIHCHQIWHLDMKPDNVMVDKNTGKVVVIDFGASKQMGQQGRYTGTTGILCYTPGFAPIEQVSQDLDSVGPWTDFYALGATLYNLLTNEMPPSFTQLQERKAVKFPSGVSKPVRNLILWMMSPNRAQRPQSVAAIYGFIAQNIKGSQQQQQYIGPSPQQQYIGPSPQQQLRPGQQYIGPTPQTDPNSPIGNISGRPSQRPDSSLPTEKKPWSQKTALIAMAIILGVLLLLVIIMSSTRGGY